MQTAGMVARTDRMAVRPGTSEFWALGTSESPVPGWSAANQEQGQVVFLRNSNGSWQFMGPPTEAGVVVNPKLADMAISGTGEGWAVGENGVLLFKRRDATEWVKHDPGSSGTTDATLQSVSLAVENGVTVGYAAGGASTVLRYTGNSDGSPGRWELEPIAPVMAADLSPGLYISTVSAEEAWAVSDGSTNGLRIYRKRSGLWEKVVVGDPIFDNPPAVGRRGGYNAVASGSSIAATGSAVWVGGRMQPSEVPLGPSNDQESSRDRPFMIQIDPGSQEVVPYCPLLYKLRQRTEDSVSTTQMCDGSFPTGSYDITSIAILGGEVFAGGLGFFHFDGNAWFREPNSNGYLISIAMSSPTEGWVATNGNSKSRGNLIRSSSAYAGHWTNRPTRSALARWPQTQGNALESVAISPDGSSAMAVGQKGAAVYFDRQLGWDKRLPFISDSLHAVAWPGDKVWAVGDRGLIFSFQNGRWSVAASNGPTLFGVAFRSPSDGVAVGANGTVMRFNGSGWSRERTGKGTLYAVTATRDGYMAAGEDGIVIENRGEGWFTHDEVRSLIPSSFGADDLFAVATTASGEVVVGGQKGLLLSAPRGGSFSHMIPPLSGTVLALAAGRDSLFASVSPDSRKYQGNEVSALRGSLLRLQGKGWVDVTLNRKLRPSDKNDSSSFDDPVLGLVTRDGVTGWAAGGTPAGTPADNPPEGHLREHQSGSIYKLDVSSDPKPPSSEASLSLPGGINFAVFGETWCGPTPPDVGGTCSSAVGTGMMADEVAIRVRDEINRAAAKPNGPMFVLFTGNMRSSGMLEELTQFKHFLDGFDIPVFAALGDRDLYGGLTAALTPSAPGTGTNDYWKQAFADWYRPWGTKALKSKWSYIQPLPFPLVQPAAGARTHYAFDVLQGGRPALRVVVLDSSTKSWGEASEQNPAEDQVAYYNSLLTGARAAGIPTVVLMNQPTVIPQKIQVPNWDAEAQPQANAFEAATVANGVTAVFTGGLRMNAKDSYLKRSGAVPLYIVGGGGAPLGFEGPTQPIGQGGVSPPATRIPSDGFYYGWQMFNIDPDPARRNLLNQAPHSVKTFMALEALGMHSHDGERVAAGNTMRFSSFATQLKGGWAKKEYTLSRATHIRMGYPVLDPCGTDGQGDIYCQSVNALPPPYRFYSEDPRLAQFVIPDFGAGGLAPAYDPFTGNMLLDRDGRYGLLCTFNRGTVGINVESGFHRRRMLITITGGSGPCINGIVVDPLDPARVKVPGAVDPVEADSPSRPLHRPPPPLDPLAVVLPPAPGPIAAPAPPASAASSRKEEEEAQLEEQGDEGDSASFTAMRHERRSQQRFDAVTGGLIMGSAVVMAALMSVVGASFVQRRRVQPEYVRWRI